jgi:ATP/maltotriose-dependent transcriptional regulator MalT
MSDIEKIAPALPGGAYGGSLLGEQIRKAFGLLQTAIEDASETAERQNAQLAAELEHLQARALRSIEESALATFELFEAIGAARSPGELATRQFDLARRRQTSVREDVADFIESAQGMVAALTGVSSTARPRGRSEESDSVIERVNTLTQRQKKVLELVAQGLPNKVIAHQLGISETTVKAHVGEILRKLKVYNRARAIAMLARIDLSAMATD